MTGHKTVSTGMFQWTLAGRDMDRTHSVSQMCSIYSATLTWFWFSINEKISWAPGETSSHSCTILNRSSFVDTDSSPDLSDSWFRNAFSPIALLSEQICKSYWSNFLPSRVTFWFCERRKVWTSLPLENFGAFGWASEFSLAFDLLDLSCTTILWCFRFLWNPPGIRVKESVRS